jgi:hypothetical protein
MEVGPFNFDELKMSAEEIWRDLSDETLYDRAYNALKPIFELSKSEKYKYSHKDLISKIFLHLKWDAGLKQQHLELVNAMLLDSSKEILTGIMFVFLFLSNLSLTEMQKRLELLFVDNCDWNISVKEQGIVYFDTAFLLEMLAKTYYYRSILIYQLTCDLFEKDDPDYEKKRNAIRQAIKGSDKDIAKFLIKKFVNKSDYEKRIPSDVFFQLLFNERSTYDLEEDMIEINPIVLATSK